MIPIFPIHAKNLKILILIKIYQSLFGIIDLHASVIPLSRIVSSENIKNLANLKFLLNI